MPIINDYKILADLLYPTIESSGNEYYGQTKKIALNSYFNDSEPFESGISTNSDHQCYFNWKLGPLSDSIKTYTSVNDSHGSYSTFPDINKIIYINNELEQEVIKDTANNINTERSVYGTSFLKYNITIDKDSMSHSIPAGVYNTYDYDVNLHLDSLIINNNLNPINNEDISDSISEFNFIFDETTSTLYVKVCSGFVVNVVSSDSSGTEENLDDSEYLVLKAVNGDVNIRYTVNMGNSYESAPTYEYSLDGESWETLDSSAGVDVESGNYILLKCTDRPNENIPQVEAMAGGDPMDPPSYNIYYGSSYSDEYWAESGYNFDDYLVYTKLIFTKMDSDSDATVEAYGNISSMVPAGSYVSAAYANLFRDCTILTRPPLINDAILNDLHCYNTFDGCTSLLKAPDLPAMSLSQLCYKGMFSGCSSLVKAPELHATSLVTECYEKMFYNCSDLSEISLEYNSFLNSSYSKDWLTGVSANGIYHLSYPQPINDGVAIDYGMPSTWINDSICSPITFIPDGDTDIIITFNNSNYYKYKKNNDFDWTPCTSGNSISLNEGDKISFARDTMYSVDYHSNSDNNYVTFSSTGTANIDAYGNVMSLIDENRIIYEEDRLTLLDINEVISGISGSATTHHYINLFKDFTCLRKAPTLYENLLSESCYENMFYGCTGIEEAPVISATNLAANCCDHMFYGCSNLAIPPVLSAESLASHCYDAMFYGCTSLELAPELPAITLANYCYAEMFSECTSLKKSPTLPAANLAPYCYNNMFSGCSDLEKVICLAKDISATDCLNGWLYDSASGIDGLLVADIKLDWQNYASDNWHLYIRNYNCNGNLDLICITGSNSEYNGRGNIYSESTLFNMESFSSVAATNELVGTYNEVDGSAIQGIWGYKCFNSPITFKNGIYGTCSSIVSYSPSLPELSSITDPNSKTWVDETVHGSALDCNIQKYTVSSNKVDPYSRVAVYHQHACNEYNQNVHAYCSTSALMSHSGINGFPKAEVSVSSYHVPYVNFNNCNRNYIKLTTGGASIEIEDVIPYGESRAKSSIKMTDTTMDSATINEAAITFKEVKIDQNDFTDTETVHVGCLAILKLTDTSVSLSYNDQLKYSSGWKLRHSSSGDRGDSSYSESSISGYIYMSNLQGDELTFLSQITNSVYHVLSTISAGNVFLAMRIK